MSDAIKPTPEIYRKAARIIEEDGWIKGVYASKSIVDPTKKCYCMEGAIMKAARIKVCYESVQGRALELLCHADEYVSQKTDYKYRDSANWNDSRKSAKPVIKMLNDIADALEKEQENA